MRYSGDGRAARKARTRDHLRTVAQRMFAESGFDAVTLAGIARRADVAVETG
ncbi:MAG TPA: TetR family transcriptional regulator [Blastococcus sp.]